MMTKSKKTTEYKGMVALFDLWEVPTERMEMPSHYIDFLNGAVERLEMTQMREAEVHHWAGKSDWDHGYTGDVLIAESHITIHSFIPRHHVQIDISSCIEFEPRVVETLLDKLFDHQIMDLKIVYRGQQPLSNQGNSALKLEQE